MLCSVGIPMHLLMYLDLVHILLSHLVGGGVVFVSWAMPYLRKLVDGFPPQRLGFDPESSSCKICRRQNGTEAGFLRVHRFLLPNIPSMTPHSSLSSSSFIIMGDWYSRPVDISVIVDSVLLYPLNV
jgi:hypothetical protein